MSVEPFHLFRYLDEQSFRFNGRKGTDAQRFAHVLSLITGKGIQYKELMVTSHAKDGGNADRNAVKDWQKQKP